MLVSLIQPCDGRSDTVRHPMFTEIRHAILPLALRNRRSGDELERTALLIESLARHWVDRKPLRLVVVAPSHDVPIIGSGLPLFRNVEVLIRGECEFFPRFSRFYA